MNHVYINLHFACKKLTIFVLLPVALPILPPCGVNLWPRLSYLCTSSLYCYTRLCIMCISLIDSHLASQSFSRYSVLRLHACYACCLVQQVGIYVESCSMQWALGILATLRARAPNYCDLLLALAKESGSATPWKLLHVRESLRKVKPDDQHGMLPSW